MRGQKQQLKAVGENLETQQPNSTDTTSPALSGVEGWKTYRNEKYGFEVRYPPSWFINEKGEGALIWFSNVSKRSPISDESLKNESDFNLQTMSVNPNLVSIDKWFAEYSKNFPSEPLSVEEIRVDSHYAIKIETSEIGRRVHIYVARGVDILEIVYRVDQPIFFDIYNQILSTLKFVK